MTTTSSRKPYKIVADNTDSAVKLWVNLDESNRGCPVYTIGADLDLGGGGSGGGNGGGGGGGGGLIVTPDGIELYIHHGEGCQDPCINVWLEGRGTETNPLLVNAKLDIDNDDPHNLLHCGPYGLTTTLNVAPAFSHNPECLELALVGMGSNDAPLSLSGRLRISEACDNILYCTDNGLEASIYMREECREGGIITRSTGVGTKLDPIVICASLDLAEEIDGNALSLVPGGLYAPSYYLNIGNDSCIDLDLYGHGTYFDQWVLTPSLNLRKSCDNMAVCTVEGLYVPPTQFVDYKSTCFETIIQGLGSIKEPYEIIVEPVIKDSVDNALACTSDGLMVPDLSHIKPCDSCGPVTLTIEGFGTKNNPKEICAHLKIDDEFANMLDITDNGLIAIPTKLKAYDTNTVAMNLTGQGTVDSIYKLNAQVIVAESPEQLLEASLDGLIVKCGSVHRCVRDLFCNSDGFKFDEDGNIQLAISEQCENQIEVLKNGDLFVPQTDFISMRGFDIWPAKDCANTFTGEINILKTADGNNLRIVDNSLYVPMYKPLDTETIDMQIDRNVISAKAKISKKDCNVLQAFDDGLFVSGYETGTFEFVIPDCVQTGDYVELTKPMMVDGELLDIGYFLGTAPVGSNLEVKLLHNGTEVHAFVVPAGSTNMTSGFSSFPKTLPFRQGDTYRIAVTSNGVSTIAECLNITLRYGYCNDISVTPRSAKPSCC